jgi:hypothetical protein
VHDPVGLLSVGGAAPVEDERLPHPDEAVLGVDGLVPPRRLPEAGGGRPVGARARRVLLVLVAEEVPLVLLLHSHLALLCLIPHVSQLCVVGLLCSESSAVTLEIPGLDFVQVDVFYDVEVYLVRRHLLPQVVVDEFLVGRVEAKSGRHMGGTVHLIHYSIVQENRDIFRKKYLYSSITVFFCCKIIFTP